MKLLSDKDALEKLFGKISIGFLLVQDFVAIIILLFVSTFSSNSPAIESLLRSCLKGTLVVVIFMPINTYILPKFSSFLAKSQELLFLFAIFWGLGLSSLFYFFGFSIEIGALIAGIMLSVSPYSKEISSKLKPLRDFFIIPFFILLGSQMVFSEISNAIFPIIVFSLFILIGNPLIVMILMGILGYSKKTGFMAGLTVAQISEFSLILISLGVKLGHLSKDILSFVTLIGLITIAGSTYLIIYSDKIYSKISKYLVIFEKKEIKEKENSEKKEYDYVLLGYNRTGFSLLKSFMKIKKNFVVVDYDPDVIKKLTKRKISCIYGDAADIETLEEINISKAKLIVSTIPETDSTILIINKIKNENKDAIIIVTARQINEALQFYKIGADYVILPHFLGGRYAAELIEKAKTDRKEYEKEKIKQINELRERLLEKQEHPFIDRD